MTELIIFFLLLVKHAIIDLALQTQLLWGRAHEKNNYFGGHQHYFHHAVGTFLVCIWFLDLSMTCLLTVLDYIAHWHIDFFKHFINLRLKVYSKKNILWWWTATIDQILHFLTYLLMILYVISKA